MLPVVEWQESTGGVGSDDGIRPSGDIQGSTEGVLEESDEGIRNKRRRIKVKAAVQEDANRNDTNDKTVQPVPVAELASSSIARWASPWQVHSNPPVLPPWDEVLAQSGSASRGRFFVCRPRRADIVRLREIEREFVADHYALYQDETWTQSTSIADWCRSVNVIQNEAAAVNAISQIVDGSCHQHVTLQCVHVPPTPIQDEPGTNPEIVGYVHFVQMPKSTDVSHLKVSNKHRGKGIGALLLAGMARFAERSDNYDCLKDLKLVVMVRNVQAVSLYKSLGFQLGDSVSKDVRGGLGKIEWTRMSRLDTKTSHVPQQILQAFLESCYERALRALAV